MSSRYCLLLARAEGAAALASAPAARHACVLLRGPCARHLGVFNEGLALRGRAALRTTRCARRRGPWRGWRACVRASSRRKSILTEEPKFTGAAWQDVSDGAKDFVKLLLTK